METFSDRKFMLLLYPEDLSHVKALEEIKRSFDYAVILHDKDELENEENKKSHWHVIITVGNNKRWNTALAKELKIEPNYIQKIRNIDRALEYLIHLNDDDKYQYSIDDVEGTLKNRLKANINSADKTEGEKISEMIDTIENEDEKITFTYFSRYCAENGLWDVYRRSAVIINKVIDEHNKACSYIRNKRKEMGFENIEDTYNESPFENGETE
jgi:hypothetical protein